MAFEAKEQARCRADFPALRRGYQGRELVYLDGPAGTQVPLPVIDAIARVYTHHNANTHGQFVTSAEGDRELADARTAVAAFLGAPSPDCISFGANMTTLCYALSHAVGRALKPGDEVLITALDHEANRSPWAALAAQGAVVREVRLLPSGTLDAADLAAKIGPRTRLVAIGYSSNALGTVNDVELARRLTRTHGAWLMVDAVHYAPHFPLDVAALDADFLLCSAYKFYGPHVGILYSRPDLLATLATDRLATQDPQAPYRIETGTLNLAAIAGVRAAVEYLASFGDGATLRERIVSAMSGIQVHEHALAARYAAAAQALPGVTVWGPGFASARRAPTVSLTVKGQRPDALARALGERGVCVWDGDFYAARAIEVLGLKDAGGVLRTGMSMYSNAEDVDRLLAALGELL
jgi:cysteine desulfurase family protein (TIGR01976 family)